MGRIWSKRNSHILLMGVEISTISEDSLALSTEDEDVIRCFYFGNIPWRKICIPGYMHKDFHSNFVHCSLRLETKKQPKFPLIVEWKNKLWYIHIRDSNVPTSNLFIWETTMYLHPMYIQSTYILHSLVNLINIMLDKRSQTQKNTEWFHLYKFNNMQNVRHK